MSVLVATLPGRCALALIGFAVGYIALAGGSPSAAPAIDPPRVVEPTPPTEPTTIRVEGARPVRSFDSTNATVVDASEDAELVRAPIAPGSGSGSQLGPWEAHRDAPVSVAGDHWLTTKSNKRHNRGCKLYFGRTYGRPCGAGEGERCGKCGG